VNAWTTQVRHLRSRLHFSWGKWESPARPVSVLQTRRSENVPLFPALTNPVKARYRRAHDYVVA
jgi:hypothetical protein